MPNSLTTAAVAVTTVLALALFIISTVSYRRVQSRRFLLLVVAFGLFAIKGVALSILLFVTTIVDLDRLFLVSSILDAAILVVLYAALVKR